MLFSKDALPAEHRALQRAHDHVMHAALIKYMRAMAVAVSHPTHPLYASNAGYRMALEDISRAIEPAATEQTEIHQPG